MYQRQKPIGQGRLTVTKAARGKAKDASGGVGSLGNDEHVGRKHAIVSYLLFSVSERTLLIFRKILGIDTPTSFRNEWSAREWEVWRNSEMLRKLMNAWLLKTYCRSPKPDVRTADFFLIKYDYRGDDRWPIANKNLRLFWDRNLTKLFQYSNAPLRIQINWNSTHLL